MVTNVSLSTEIGEKIRAMRESEGLTRLQFFELTGIPAVTQKSYETGRRESIGSGTLLKITQHPRFEKYTLWLMTDSIAPESGQIAPVLSPSGQEETILQHSVKKTG